MTLINQHLIWLVSNCIIIILLVLGILTVLFGMKKYETLRTKDGAGIYFLTALFLLIIPAVSEAFDELDSVLLINIYPDELYSIVKSFSSMLFFLPGTIFIIIGIYRQIVVGERLKSELIAKNTELTASKEELSHFAHFMVHDLKNNLNRIRAFSTYLKSYDFDPEYVEKIEKQVDLIDLLMTKSVDLADLGLVIGKKEECKLLNIVFQAAENILYPNDISLELEPEELPVVIADKEKLYQVFKNIFGNVVDHTNATKVIIKGEQDEEKTEYYIYISNDSDPMPEEIRKKIFTYHFSTKRTKGGLGLKIVYTIIKAHNWDITLCDTKITTFKITIPAKYIKKYSEDH